MLLERNVGEETEGGLNQIGRERGGAWEIKARCEGKRNHLLTNPRQCQRRSSTGPRGPFFWEVLAPPTNMEKLVRAGVKVLFEEVCTRK